MRTERFCFFFSNPVSFGSCNFSKFCSKTVVSSSVYLSHLLSQAATRSQLSFCAFCLKTLPSQIHKFIRSPFYFSSDCRQHYCQTFCHKKSPFFSNFQYYFPHLKPLPSFLKVFPVSTNNLSEILSAWFATGSQSQEQMLCVFITATLYIQNQTLF